MWVEKTAPRAYACALCGGHFDTALTGPYFTNGRMVLCIACYQVCILSV